MKYFLSVLIFTLVLFSCSIKNEEEKNSIHKIDGWNVIIRKGKTDILNTKDWFPEAELRLKYINKSDSTCLTPTLDFYPIKHENYIKDKLVNYLVLRATLFPAAPNTYKNNEYFVIGWNFSDYDNLKCCDCNDLETELIKNLKLEIKEKPVKLFFDK